MLFHDDADRRRFMGTLGLVCDRYNLEVYAYCLMDNHVHLVLRCPDGRLSDALRDLKSIYARWFKARHRSTGELSVHVPGTCTLRVDSGSQHGLAHILIAVARAAGTDVADVHPKRRNGLIGIAVILARQDAGFQYSEIAEPFGYRTKRAAQIAAQRTTSRLSDRPELQAVLHAARVSLWPKAA